MTDHAVTPEIRPGVGTLSEPSEPAPCPECGRAAGHLLYCKARLRELAIAPAPASATVALVNERDALVEERAGLLAGLDVLEAEVVALRARVAELEAHHDQAGDLFASGRRYERAWAGLSGGHFWPQAIAEHGRMIDHLGNVLAGQLGPSFAAVVAHVAELEAECQRRFVQTSNDGERIAELEGLIERLRVLVATSAARTRDVEAAFDLVADIAALLPKEAP